MCGHAHKTVSRGEITMFVRRYSFLAPVLGALVALLGSSTGNAHEWGSNQDSQNQADCNAKLDPQMAKVIAVYKKIAGAPIYTLTPQDARQQFSAEDAAKAVARLKGLAEAPEPVGKVEDMRMIPGAAGPLTVRIYTPTGDGPFPVIVYFHGGGFAIATIDTYDTSARALTNLAGAIVISVEYRKAPENKFPAAVEDAVASYQWALANAASLNGNPDKMAVAGESAGGNLATVVCLLARDRGVKMPVHQLLVYPITNNDIETPSYLEYAHAIPLNKPAMEWFFQNYLLNLEDGNNPLVSPLKANLQGLPSATIIGAEIDPLQSEGKQYADKLKAAGIPVDYKLYFGVTHEFFGMGAVVDKAKEAESQAAADLRAAFSK
jgi:acetyl esterase